MWTPPPNIREILQVNSDLCFSILLFLFFFSHCFFHLLGLGVVLGRGPGARLWTQAWTHSRGALAPSLRPRSPGQVTCDPEPGPPWLQMRVTSPQVQAVAVKSAGSNAWQGVRAF